MTTDTDLGKIDISPHALASLVSHSVKQTYGVVSMAEPTRVGSITASLTRDPHKGVGIYVESHNVTIDVYVIVNYGTNLASVANSIISAIRYHIEDRTPFSVAQVNVHIQGMRMTFDDAGF